MVAPLVDDMELLALDGHVVDSVLRENRQMIALDHLRDAVVDFGVDMIRTADEQDGVLTRLLDAFENLCAIVAHVLAVLRELLVGRIDGRSDFIFRQMFVFERFHEALRHALFVVDGQEWLDKINILFAQDVHVAADVFGIRGDNRAVVVIFGRMLFIDHVVGLARIENLRDALLNEVHDVAVRDFRRITERVRRHGRHAFVIHLGRRLARQLHAVAEIREEREPERIVLVHVQHARNADRAALRVFERLIVAEETAVLVLVDVRRLVLVRLLAADAAFAAVAREILAAVREFLHRDQALVAAALAAVRARLHIEMLEFARREQRRLLAPRFEREDGRAIRAHDACDVGTDDVAVQEFFHAAQHGIVVERAALHDDMVAERAHVLELHDLEQCILDDGERDARRDVSDLRALFLRLLDFRIHEDRAARAEVDRRFRADGQLCKLGRRHVQALGEVLDERAAARRARLVERDVADAAVLDEEALHVLPADVEHKRDLGAEFLRGTQMRKRLDLAAVRMDAGLHNGLAITRRHAAGHMRLFRQYLVKVLQLRDDALEWRAVVAAIGRIQEFLVLADGRDLRRGRTRVDAEIDRPLVMLEITARHLVAVVARLECRIVRFIRKQREIRLARLAGRRFFRAADGIFKAGRIDGLCLV